MPYVQLLIDISSGDKQSEHGSSSSRALSKEILVSAAKALLSHLAWFDISGSITTGSGPFLGLDYIRLIDSNVIQLDSVHGCHNVAVRSLCEVLNLHRWKLEAERGKALNVMNLVARGDTILQSLTNTISQLSNWQCDAEVSGQMPWRESDRDITLAFTRAATIYLHVVISGPNSRLTEIRQEVIQLTQVIQRLFTKRMIQNVTWPLTVMACFAVEDVTHDFLKEVDRCQDVSSELFTPSIKEALKIGRECQRMSQKTGKDYDWMLVLKDSGKSILLG